jgi:signal transduction histidine kinase
MSEGAAVERWRVLAWLRSWPRRHPMLVDALALVIVLPPAFQQPEDGGPWHHPALWSVLLAVPLIVRRRYPMIVFGCVAVVAVAQWLLLNQAVIADVALLIALYTVATNRDHVRAAIAWGVLEIGVIMAVWKWSGPDGRMPSFVFLTGMASAVFVIGRNVRARRVYLASVEDRARRAEHERDQQARLAAAAERARIAREMHDIVTHNLSVMIALADGAAFSAGGNPRAAEDAARQVSATGRQALAEMHRLLGVLRDDGAAPLRTPQPGIEQLDLLAAQVRSAGLPISLALAGTPFPVPPTAQLVVYRVVQEALTNVLKHADSPTAARVTVRYQDPLLAVEIEDDGSGAAPRNGHGHGLDGMAERVAMFDGRIEAGPRNGGGWRVRATLTAGREAA